MGCDYCFVNNPITFKGLRGDFQTKSQQSWGGFANMGGPKRNSVVHPCKFTSPPPFRALPKSHAHSFLLQVDLSWLSLSRSLVAFYEGVYILGSTARVH